MFTRLASGLAGAVDLALYRCEAGAGSLRAGRLANWGGFTLGCCVSAILSGGQPVAGSLRAISSRLSTLRCRPPGVIGCALPVACGLVCDLRRAGR